MPATEIIETYHTLWKIEESFRIMKSTLEVRPIFHWKPERIHGHFVVCFLAFMLERKLEMMLNDNEIKNSPEKIREALNSMQLAKTSFNNEEVYIKTKNAPLASQIFKLLKMNLPHNLNNKEQISEILKINKKLSWGQISLF